MNKLIKKTPIEKKNNITIIDDDDNDNNNDNIENNIHDQVSGQDGGYENKKSNKSKKQNKKLDDDETDKDDKDDKDENDENDDKDDNDEHPENDDNENENEDNHTTTEADDKCFYKFASPGKNKGSAENEDIGEGGEEDLDSDAEDENIIEEEIKETHDGVHGKTKLVLPEERITKPILTKYERVRLLGDRSKQLSLGAPPMIKNAENLTPREIAELEIINKIIPIIIRRPMPNGLEEEWHITELELPS